MQIGLRVLDMNYLLRLWHDWRNQMHIERPVPMNLVDENEKQKEQIAYRQEIDRSMSRKINW